MATNDTEVLIAGAGPCGLALANLLGRYGCRVTVIEARGDLIDYPRGVGLDDESLRTIQTMGLVDEVTPFTVPHHVMRLVNGRGETMVTNDPKGEPFGWPRKHGFIQPLVDRVFCDGLARFDNVSVEFDSRLTGITETADGVTAEVTASDDTVRQISADYLVGCEGGGSFTRKWLGVEFEGRSPSTRWVVIDVRNDPLGVPNVYLGADPARPYVSIGLPHAIRRWEFMLFDDEPSERVEDDAFVAELLEGHVPDPSSLDVIRRRVFTHHGRIASSFRRGRVMVAGDAAHLMPVWMGQGWNSGMRDATNLAWKLATVVSGAASEALLDTYDSERRDHAKAMIDLSMTFGSVIKPTDRRVALLRDTAARTMNLVPQVKDWFTDMRFKPMPRYGEGVVVDVDDLTPGRARQRRGGPRLGIVARNVVEKTSPVGLQFIQPRVSTTSQASVLLDDAIGDWWTMLAWGNHPLRLLSEPEHDLLRTHRIRPVAAFSETQRAWAEQEYAALEGLVVGDTSNQLKGWFDTRAVGVVFVRPDRFVAAACLAQDSGRALHAVLESAYARPTPPSPAPPTREKTR